MSIPFEKLKCNAIIYHFTVEWQYLIEHGGFDENRLMSYIQGQALEAPRDLKLGEKYEMRRRKE